MPKQTDKAAEQGATAVREIPADPQVLYEQDFGSWALKQAEALRNRDVGAIDWDNLVEELEFLAKEGPKTWESQCERAVEHMLKIEHCDDDGSEQLHMWVSHWQAETRAARRNMQEAAMSKTVEKDQLEEMLQRAWIPGAKAACDFLDMRYFKTRDPGMERRAQELRKHAENECPWRLVEVAGYNPRTKDEEEQPRQYVWPPRVAARLNQVIDPPPAYSFHTKGWKAGPMGTILKRGGRVRQGLAHDIPVAEPDR